VKHSEGRPSGLSRISRPARVKLVVMVVALAGLMVASPLLAGFGKTIQEAPLISTSLTASPRMTGPFPSSGVAPHYPVKFTESGLASGTSWWVTLNGTLRNSTSASITFSEPNGTYPYRIGTTSGGILKSPNATGTVRVAGAPNTVVVPSIGVGSTPYAIAYDASNGYLYVVNEVSDNVTVIDGTNNSVVVPSIGVGSQPFAIAYDASNGHLYVPNTGSDNVTVIDGTNNSVVVPSIGVGDFPDAITYDASNSYLYVANDYTDNVTVIDGANNSVVMPSIGVGSVPEAIAYDPSNGYLYVANSGSNNVTVIDGANNTVVVPSIRVGHLPEAIAYDPSNGYLYVVNTGSGNVTVIDGASNTVVVPSIGVGFEPFAIACDPLNGYLYVANYGSGNVTVIDGVSNSVVVPSIGGDPTPSGIAYDPLNGYVYVGGGGANNVTAINGNGIVSTLWGPAYSVTFTESGLASGTRWSVTLNGTLHNSTTASITFSEPNGTYPYRIGTTSGGILRSPNATGTVRVAGAPNTVVVPSIGVGSGPTGIAYDAMNGYLYVANYGSDNVTVIDSANNTVVVPSIGVGSGPTGIAYDATNGYLYVANSGSNNVTVIGSANNAVVVPSIGVGSGPTGITYDATNGYLYVANSGSNNVTVIDSANNTVVVPSIGVGSAPVAIAYDPSNGYLYAANSGSGNVTVIDGASNSVVVPSIGVGSGPTGIAYDATNGYLYVANYASGNVTVINGASNSVVVPSIGAGSYPAAVAYDPTNGYLYVANSGSDNVTAIDGASNTVAVPSIGVGFNPRAIAYDPTSGYLYVVNTGSGNLTAISANGFVSTVWSPMYSVTFTESDLAYGTPWSVTLNGTLRNSANASIAFTELNGTYNYSVNSPGWQPSPTTGSVKVSGANPAAVSIQFTQVTYTVTFTESGLPLTPGPEWNVTLNGVTHSSSTSTVTFTEPDGTYNYSVNSPGWQPSPTTGSVEVSGANPTALSIQFIEVTYTVAFTESGLPSTTGPEWNVTLNGVTHSSSTSMITFEEPNGTYRYSVESISGYTVTPAAGNLTVHGTPVSQALVFSATSGGGSSSGFLMEI